ncbi:MAG: serine hydrolase [Cyclobacteriaceae bacterium]
MKIYSILWSIPFLLFGYFSLNDSEIYPIDGYSSTGIRRLAYLEKKLSGEVTGTPIINGAKKSISEIKLNLLDTRGDSLAALPTAADPDFQKAINRIFPNLDESYSYTILDITPGRPIRYAKRQESKGFQPGSVGKLAILIALFDQLEKLYPDSFEKRQDLLRSTMVTAGSWVVTDEHTVPIFNPETGKYLNRTVKEKDVFSLYEWADHMMNVSNNGAASVVWREVMLMSVFGNEYPVAQERADEYFKNTKKSELATFSVSLVNEPLRVLGIDENEWRLGSMFTRGAKAIVPGSGGSIGSPTGLLKFLVAVERGDVVDSVSSLEMKRMMYMTGKRIRYAAAYVLKDAAVYFKSGSLYSCVPEEGFECQKYYGNSKNYMNSVAIVEHPDGTTYMAVLMSNVLKKNSSNDHFGLATQIDQIIRGTTKK